MSCKITKLTDVVNNDNLQIFGSAVFTNKDDNNRIDVVIKDGESCVFSILDEDNSIVWTGGVRDKTCSGSITLTWSGTLLNYKVSNKYALQKVNTKGANTSSLKGIVELLQTTLQFSDGSLTDLEDCIKLTSAVLNYGTIRGSINELAERHIANGRTSGELAITCNGYITYYNGSANPAPSNGGVVVVVFKTGGYELHLTSADGEKVYDSINN